MCAGMGYKGRVAVAEVLLFDDDMDEMVAQSASKADLKKIAVEKGFKSMKDDGVLKVLDGTTSIEALSKAVDTSK
jgi:type IV pilus assembly protein PilB